MPRHKSFDKRKYYGKKDKSSAENAGIGKKTGSSSSKKLSDGKKIFESFEQDSKGDGFMVVNVQLLANAISNFAVCGICKCNITFSLNEKSKTGLAVESLFQCTNCDNKLTFWNSNINNKFHEVNIRFAYGMRMIGRGRGPANLLCGIMDLPQPVVRFNRLYSEINRAVQVVADDSMRRAADEAIETNKGCRDIAVAVDGTWQKRGYTSLNGVVTATSVDSGKIIDIECLSKYCQECLQAKNQQNNTHVQICTQKFHGNSGAMEVEGAIRIFSRSFADRGVRYTNYLGDGDSKAFEKVKEMHIYGPNVEIEKLECIGHIQKRMGSRLRNMKKKCKGQKLKDGKGLDGRNRLTDGRIDKLQAYYGNAIRSNVSDVNSMKRAVWATYFHTLSTDALPQHGLCPDGANTWCGYKRANITGDDYTHKNSLPEAILLKIKPIFQDLSKTELLKKCLHGKTQNPNESVNNLIWSRAPKTVFVGLETLQMVAFDTVIVYNDGNCGRVQVLEKLGLKAGKNCVEILKGIDDGRVKQAEKQANLMSIESRKKERNIKRVREEEENDNDCSYGAGLF